MAAKYTHDVVATNGSYRDREGNEKKRYVTVGKVFTQDDGRMNLKLDVIPVGPDWSGWLSLYVRDEERGGSGNSRPVKAHGPRTEGDDIPF
jgi:hypothetical protein